MNEPRDPLEAELAAFRPLEVSPELRRRVADRLASERPSRIRRWWPPALAAGLAAACLAVVIFKWGGGGSGPVAIPHRTEPAVAAEDPDPAPSLLAYQRALARSPEDLGALIDKQAMAGPGPGPRLVHTLGFGRSAAALTALLGDD